MNVRGYIEQTTIGTQLKTISKSWTHTSEVRLASCNNINDRIETRA